MRKVGGFICPDLEGLRHFYAIEEKKLYSFQVAEEIPGKTVRIGRFHFLLSTFKKAKKLMKQAMLQHYDYVVIDELGKLEIERNEGLEPVLSQLIAHYQQESSEGNLILVVRDYLVNAVTEHYQLRTPVLIDELNQWNFKNR